MATTSVPRPRRLLRRIALWSGGVLAGIVVLAGLALLVLQTGPAKTWLAAVLSDLASEASGFSVRIGGLDGTIPGDIRLAEVAIADADGVWLRASDLALDWQPAALLAGRLSIARLSVARLDIARAPVPAAESPPPSPPSAPWAIELPKLPLAVALANLEIAEIRLGGALLGEEMTLAAFGSAALAGAPQAAELALTVLRLDGKPARIELTLEQAAPGGALTLDATVEEPAGGLVARLLALPDLPAVSLRLAGSGPADDWRGRLDAVAGAAFAHLDLTLALDARVDLTLAGELDPGGLAGPDLRDLLPRPVALAAALAWTPGGTLDIAHAELSAPGVAASLAGSIDPDAETVDASATLALDDAALIARLADPVSAAGLRATIDIAGDLAAPRVAVDATIDQPRGPGAAADSIGIIANLGPAEDPGRLALDARVTPLGLAISEPAALGPSIGPAPILTLAGTLDPVHGRLDIATLAIAGSGFRLGGGGRVAEVGRDLDLALALRVDDLAPFGELAGLAMQGGLDADIRLFGDATLPALAADLDLRGDGVAIASEFVQALVGAQPHVVAGVTLDGAAITLDRATIDAAAARLEAHGTITDRLDLTLALDAADLDTLTPAVGAALAGRLTATGRVSGPLDDPVVTAELAGQGIAVEGVALGAVTGRVAVRDLGGEPQGDLDLALAPRGPELRATTRFVVARSGDVRFDALTLDGGGTRVAGDLGITPDGLIEAELRGEVKDLAAWQNAAGTALGGALGFRVSAAAEGGRQHLSVAATGRDVALAESVTLRGLRLDAEIADALATPVLDAKLAAEGVASGTVKFETVNASATGALTDLAWTLAAAGAADEDGAAIDANGRLALGGSGGSVTLAALAARLPPVEAALARPATIAWNESGVRLDDLDARLGDGRITAAGTIGADGMAVNATLADLPVRPLAALAGGAELDGRLSGEIALRGDPAAPDGRASLNLTALREAGVDPAEAVALSGALEAMLSGGRIEATGQLGGPSDFNLEARVAAPLAGDGPLDGKVAGSLDLTLLPSIVDLYGDALAGTLDLDLTLSGSLARPQSGGRATISGGAYESAAQGTVLRDLTMEVVGDNDRVRLVSLAANDGNGGSISATGTLAVDPAAGFPIEMALGLDRFTALRRADATVQASGKLDIARNASGGRVAGTVTVDAAELRVPDRLGGEVVTLDVTEINLPPGREPQVRRRREPDSPLDLDVDVEVPGKAFLRGRGLDSEWRGRLKIAGTTAAPDITGNLRVVRGTLDLLGRVFHFDQGKVDFFGGGEIDPTLDFTAESETETLTVQAAVSGTASAPSFALSSNPALPQDEILARLLFDSSAGQLTPIQAVQLAQTAATLSGEGGSVSILDELRQGFGLDMLGIESGETVAGSSLTVGKYIAEGVFVKANQGITPESRKVGVEVRVLPRVTIESDVGAESEGSVGINWKLDY